MTSLTPLSFLLLLRSLLYTPSLSSLKASMEVYNRFQPQKQLLCLGFVSEFALLYNIRLALAIQAWVDWAPAPKTKNRGWQTLAHSSYKIQIHTCTTETRLNGE